MKSIECPNFYAHHIANAWDKFEKLKDNPSKTLVDAYILTYNTLAGTPAFNKPKTNKLLNELAVKMRNAADPDYKRKKATVTGYVNKLKSTIDYCARHELENFGADGCVHVPLIIVSKEELNELEEKLTARECVGIK